MNRISRRVAIGATAVAVLGGGLIAAVPAIGAGSSPAMSAAGNFTSGPFSVQFTASRAAGSSTVTGNFTAETSLGGIPLLTVAGPVTCLDVVGNRVGLFYPVNSSNPAVLSQIGAGVYLSAQLGPGGRPQAVSFLPLPVSRLGHCAPLPGLLPISSGTLTLSP